MITVKNPNQLNIFDPWAHLTPKQRHLLETIWPGLFREHILPSIPVGKVAKFFDRTCGRPTKALYAMLGALIIQQTLDLTDDETIRQYSLDTQWHYALNITEVSDDAMYMSHKTLWNNRNIISEKGKIVACPQGNAPGKVRIRKRVSIGFDVKDCGNCPNLSRCPVEKGNKYMLMN